MEDYCPQRLLHIPTRISVERNGFATYAGIHKPTYSILAYTWVRWEIRDSLSAPALQVKGVTWPIPPIQEGHFTVEAFSKVVSLLADEHCEWAWIDVACINQVDEAQKAHEVGSQASIFKNASRVYVRLSHLKTAMFLDATETMEDDCSLLGDFANKFFEVEYQPRNLVTAAIKRLYRLCDFVLNDPWFSSLWTLQEYTLRNDINILFAEGEAIIANSLTANLAQLRASLAGLHDNLDYFLSSSDIENSSSDTNNQEVVEMAMKIKLMVDRSGFHHYAWHSNPNVQYGTVRFRTTTRLTDSVYAITQVYNL